MLYKGLEKNYAIFYVDVFLEKSRKKINFDSDLLLNDVRDNVITKINNKSDSFSQESKNLNILSKFEAFCGNVLTYVTKINV